MKIKKILINQKLLNILLLLNIVLKNMEIKLEKSLTQFLKNQERIINHVYLINRLVQLYKKFIQVNKIMKFKIKKIWKIFINKIMVRIMFNLIIDKTR